MQAMIITAYKDFAALERVLCALSRRALCFVHVDKKPSTGAAYITCMRLSIFAPWRLRIGA